VKLVKALAFVTISIALGWALPFLAPVRTLIAAAACDLGHTFEWKQTSAGTTTSWSWVCVDPEGRFSVSESSIDTGSALGSVIAIVAGFLLTGVVFVAVWAYRRRARGAA
jgi:hypothetical protein